MADDITPSQDQTPDAGVEEQQEVTQDVGDEQQEGGYNPAWEPLRQQLGLQFETIKPELAKIDKSFNEHVTKVNGQYAPWKQFAEQGITPEQVSQAFTMLRVMNDNPEEIHAALGKYLQENGRLPENAAEAAQAVEDAASDDDDEFLSDEAKEIKALKQQLADFKALVTGQTEQAQQAAEAAQREAMVVQAEQELQQEFTAFKTAHPGISDEDMLEIQQRHYFYALQGPEHIRSLEDVGKEFFALQERIRSTPRPTDKAPRLPGAGGAVPQGQAKDPSEYSRAESQDALAALLMQGRQQ